jgi:hypothetical protein
MHTKIPTVRSVRRPHARRRERIIRSSRFEQNVKVYLEARKPDSRYASFDYCFSYFQSFRPGESQALAASKNVYLSCLHLGFYLASWGMYRGSTWLRTKSVTSLVPVIETIAGMESDVWNIDANCYTDPNICKLIEASELLRQSCPVKMTDALVTKIMLGVFGNVPAFDAYFTEGIHITRFGTKALRTIRDFYQDNAAVIDRNRKAVLVFPTSKRALRRYTRAKVIDMGFYIEGQRLSARSVRRRASERSR